MMRNKLKKVFPVFAAAFVVTLVMLSASFLISPVRGVVAEANPATPDTAGLYGGSIIWIETLDLGDNQTRVFVSTQSANSIFYADINHTDADPFSNVKFQIIPDLDAEAGFGVIQTFAVDQASGWLYFAWSPDQSASGTTDNTSRQPGIYRCTTEAGSLTKLEFAPEDNFGPSSGLGGVNSLTIHNGHMLFVEQTWPSMKQTQSPDNQTSDNQTQSPDNQTSILRLRFGTIDPATGAFTEDSQSRIVLKENYTKGQIMAPVIDPVTNLVYILDCGAYWSGNDIDGVIYKSSDPYDALNSSTTFTQITPPSGTSDLVRQYQSLGIAPDGNLYLAGWQEMENGNNESVVVYSTDDGATWETGTRDQYCWAWQGPNFAFIDNGSGGYDPITGNMISDDEGAVWGMLPRTGNVWPHPGAIAFDPNAENTFYVGTDCGIAVSNDAGYSFTKAWERPDQTNVEDIEVIDLGGNKSGIFIRERENQQASTGQPNNNPTTVYYAEIDHSTSPPTYGEFAAVPSMGEGSQWQIRSSFAGDSTSGLLFFEGVPNSDNMSANGLYSTDGKTEPTLVDIKSGNGGNPLIYNGHMFYVNSSWGDGYWDNGNWVQGQPGSNLYFGTLSDNGTFTAGGQVQITRTPGFWPEKMAIDPNDGCIYLLNNNAMGSDMQIGTEIYKSSDAYDALSSSTTFTKINTPSDSGTSYQWRAFGVGPDGRLFLGG